jgi:hypothetical protein
VPREESNVVDPKLEMQRLAGKFAFLFAGVYLIILFGAVVTTTKGDRIPLIAWPLLLLPAAAFGPSVLDAVKLHRTSDRAVLARLWWHSLGLAVIGMLLVVAAVIIVGRIERA